MAGLEIDPELFYDAAGAYSQASRDASSALRTFDTALRAAIKMTGGDPGGMQWGGKYVVAGFEAAVTAGKATEVLFRMAALLRQDGVNHDQSEEAEEYNQPGGPLPDSAPEGHTFTVRVFKNPGEGSRPIPAGWSVIMPGEEWINGDPDKLQTAADAWNRLASTYQALDNGIKPKMKQLMTSTAPELPDADQASRMVLDGLEILADAIRQQSSATGGYGQVLSAAQGGIERELTTQAVAQALNTMNALTIGRPIAPLIREAAEIEIEYSRGRIRDMLTTLAEARTLTMATMDGVSTMVTSTINTKFAPVLNKQLKRPPERTKAKTARDNRARGARAENRAGIDPTKRKSSIPSPTGSGRRIPDDLDDVNKKLTEVKNVQYQAYTAQIEDFVLFTQSSGYSFDLIVDNNTKLDAQIQNLANQGKINIIRMDLNT